MTSTRTLLRAAIHTPLHLAAHNGHTEVMTCLIKAGADLEANTSEGCTPLHGAAQNGHTEEMAALIEAAAALEARTPKQRCHAAALVFNHEAPSRGGAADTGRCRSDHMQPRRSHTTPGCRAWGLGIVGIASGGQPRARTSRNTFRCEGAAQTRLPKRRTRKRWKHSSWQGAMSTPIYICGSARTCERRQVTSPLEIELLVNYF